METRLPEVEEILIAWILSLEGEGKSPKTCRDYNAFARKYMVWLDREQATWDAVTPRILDSWKSHLIRERRLGARAVNCNICAVRSLYKWAKWQGYVPVSLPADLKIMKPPRLLPKPVNEGDVLRVIAAAQSPLERAIVEIFYSTGCRISELLGMKRSDIDLERRTILTLGKGAQERYLELGSHAARALEVYLPMLPDERREASLWPSRGGILTQRSIRRILRGLAKRAGVREDVRPHRLRHSFATHMLDHGADLREVQELMGHKSIVSTQVYTHVSRERIKRAHRLCHPRA
jgi:site-specific recombinase XerD